MERIGREQRKWVAQNLIEDPAKRSLVIMEENLCTSYRVEDNQILETNLGHGKEDREEVIRNPNPTEDVSTPRNQGLNEDRKNPIYPRKTWSWKKEARKCNFRTDTAEQGKSSKRSLDFQ